MDAVSLLRNQVASGHSMFTALVRNITPDEWLARPYDGANLPGFTAWHVPAVQDWALHTWMRGLPELRSGSDFHELPGVDPPFAPFGMSLVEADGIAAAIAPSDVLAYADAVLESAGALFDRLSDSGLDDVPDTRSHGVQLPQHRAAGYLAEVDDMYDLPVWRLLAGPCFGHLREHVGETRVCLDILRNRSLPRRSS